MIDLLENRVYSVADTLLVANTPVYLLKRLRQSLVDLAKEIPIDRIVKELRKELSDSSPNQFDLQNTAYVYALFVLMTYEPYQYVRDELRWIRESGLRWIREVIEHYERSAVTLDLVTVDIPARNAPFYTTTATDNTNTPISLDIAQG
ncbi:MAG: hypothetical protein OXP69_22175 [Spirochaetaceae bacterium]|nr:hypothetical protein [Spirochaetaceae bacterium]